jgi:hypothetical protein
VNKRALWFANIQDGCEIAYFGSVNHFVIAKTFVPTNIPLRVVKSCSDTEANNSDRALYARFCMTLVCGRLVAMRQSAVPGQVQVLEIAEPGRLSSVTLIWLAELANFGELYYSTELGVKQPGGSAHPCRETSGCVLIQSIRNTISRCGTRRFHSRRSRGASTRGESSQSGV